MRRTLLTVAVASLALAATACSSSSDKPAAAPPAATTPATTTPTPAGPSVAPASAATTTAAAVDAAAVTAKLAKAIPGLKQVKAYTAEDDPNHLLGRPGQYTSKTAFTDPRVKAVDVDGQAEDAIIRGGSIEVFATEADAAARAGYLAGVIKALPLALEYDYVVHGTVLIRASKLLTPEQAKALQAAAG
jgi:hypothetical protein